MDKQRSGGAGATPVVNALTFDLEDWYQTSELDAYVGRERWDDCPSRLEGTTYRLLALLDAAHTRATFFVLGWNAERHGTLVREIWRQGHEIALHGYHHALLTEQTPVQFAWELTRCCQLIEELTGQRPEGYRAASFSVVGESLWALDLLHEHGIRYDSSILPVRQGGRGIPGSPRFPFRIRLQRGVITELPVSTLAWAGWRLGFSGGAHFRFLPYGFVRAGIRHLNRCGQPAVVHLRPCEIDPEQPRAPLPLGLRLRCYGNLDQTEGKLRALLRDLPFAPARDVLAGAGALPAYALDPAGADPSPGGRSLFRPLEEPA